MRPMRWSFWTCCRSDIRNRNRLTGNFSDFAYRCYGESLTPSTLIWPRLVIRGVAFWILCLENSLHCWYGESKPLRIVRRVSSSEYYWYGELSTPLVVDKGLGSRRKSKRLSNYVRDLCRTDLYPKIENPSHWFVPLTYFHTIKSPTVDQKSKFSIRIIEWLNVNDLM